LHEYSPILTIDYLGTDCRWRIAPSRAGPPS
jgi:hypothetical protein